LTQLQLDPYLIQPEQQQQLSQLSALVNLEELWIKLPSGGIPGGLPSQLQKLTCLKLSDRMVSGFDAAEQFQHLGSLTALQNLSIAGYLTDEVGLIIQASLGNFTPISPSNLAGIQHLSQLTSLQLNCPGLKFSAAGTNSWARLTALQKLSLAECAVEADALAAFTQLRALSVYEVQRSASLEGLLLAVSGMPQLTELCLAIQRLTVPPTRSGACTALTIGPNLCSLQMGIAKFPGTTVPAGCDLFTPGTVYPHMRLIDLCYDGGQVNYLKRMPVSEQQLQQLCRCCAKLLPCCAKPGILPEL
jgi:hypothetical protein